jgi:hypothetical protein
MGPPARMGWAPIHATAQKPGQVSCLSQIYGNSGPVSQSLVSPPLKSPSSILVPSHPPIGWDCSQDVDECEAQGPPRCRNGGTCQNSPGSFHCVCVSGWGGTGCEENLDDCVAATCAPGSTCIDRVGSFSCLCPPGRTGQDREYWEVGGSRWRVKEAPGWAVRLQAAFKNLDPSNSCRPPVPPGRHVSEPAMPWGRPVQYQSSDGLYTLPVPAWLLRTHLSPGPG